MRDKIQNILAVVCLILLAGCKGTDSTRVIQPEISVTLLPTGMPMGTPYVFKTSEPGTTTLHGLLLVTNPNVMLPDPNDALFLVPLAGEGVMSIPPFEVGTVPQAEVDERTGEYTFTNIQPGQYALVVLVVGGTQVPATFYKDGSLAIVKIEEKDRDQTIELDEIGI